MVQSLEQAQSRREQAEATIAAVEQAIADNQDATQQQIADQVGVNQRRVSRVTLKLDPGSKTTGIALVRESETVNVGTGAIHITVHILNLFELQHRRQQSLIGAVTGYYESHEPDSPQPLQSAGDFVSTRWKPPADRDLMFTLLYSGVFNFA
jgi:Holliday junction resolvasome RuvABC endonuclease subunit